MYDIRFHEYDILKNNQLKYAIIMAKMDDKWIFVRHKDRTTWEIPGGHREENEHIEQAAERELIEETGAIDFTIKPVCIYSVKNEGIETFGALFIAEVFKLGELPDFEIAEITLSKSLPDNLTYPAIQPVLFHHVIK
ncbi:putative 8-oxo-dGTP diphosphatase YtkD [Caloramator mitchellensis]|uniref:Putative 8-oxo-dGTP diphosphatase YtkD n=1 Tax=Caloramator mitchellensis TaxID=908809 RepID=A0A0R3K0S6_CALMK|nr:NUDIX domain-containing protein [Caloramator mitchellensis]KRQ87118.1 putative 8-oxo-dGTP diphosphatase YtkD [Caloramator mitchellensis]